MICVTCLTRAYSTDEQKDALIAHQFAQLHRLTGGTYEAPAAEDLVGAVHLPPPEPQPDVLALVTAALDSDGIFRKPGRVAAPRLLERLATAGLTIHMEEP